MDKQRLGRKIYITYKARINAAERLKKTESYVQGINIYYSLFLIALSIYSVNSHTNQLSIILTIMSVIVTVTIVYLAAKRYGERGKDLKNNYISLGRLYDTLDAKDNTDDFQSISDQYTELLNSSENHSEYDYICALRNIPDERDKLSKFQKAVYIFHIFGLSLTVVATILAPFLIKYIALLLELITEL